MHPLKLAYNTYIKQHYKAWPRSNGLAKTEQVARKVARLGISYDVFVEVAVSLWHRWAKKQGWDYPYWGLVSSDKSIERVKELLKYADLLPDANSSHGDDFKIELSFAMDYVWWMVGAEGPRPRRSKSVTPKVIADVAEYMCAIYGVDVPTSNYNDIAEAMESQQWHNWQRT